MEDSAHHSPLGQLLPPTEPLPVGERPRRPGTHLEEGAVGALSPQALRARLVLTVLLVDLELLHLPGSAAASRGSQNPRQVTALWAGTPGPLGPPDVSPSLGAPSISDAVAVAGQPGNSRAEAPSQGCPSPATSLKTFGP